MKAAKLYQLSDIRIEEIPVPEIGENEALVRMKACGICGSDTMEWYVSKKAPFILGHEPTGVIEKVGGNVHNFKAGDRVFVHHHAPCFECKFCLKKQYSLCKTWKASRIDPGGMAEYFCVPMTNLQGDTFKLPASLSFEDGALIEPTACVVKSFRRAGLQQQDRLLIIGLGVMGQTHILLAKHFGVEQIIAADRVPYRLKQAQEFGADAVVNVATENLADRVKQLTKGQFADVVIVGPDNTAAMQTGISCVGKGGTVLFFTPAPENEMLSIHPYHLYFNEINLISSYSCGPDDTREAFQLIKQGVITAKKLVTHTFPLKKIEQAVAVMLRAQDSLKILIVNER
ncbi:MAG: alcohol dehydrogenase catalytic domain-containing protein [bacterium]